jgi:hypothetical protein
MGLSFSDYFDDSIPYEVKPVPSLRPMEENYLDDLKGQLSSGDDGWLDKHGNFFPADNTEAHFGLALMILSDLNKLDPNRDYEGYEAYDIMYNLGFIRIVAVPGKNSIYISYKYQPTSIQWRTLKNFCIENKIRLFLDKPLSKPSEIDLLETDDPIEEDDYTIQAKNLFTLQNIAENKSLLSETHLQDLYHVTSISELLGILRSNSLKLAFVGGTKSDQDYNQGHPFFLSTMRQKYGNFARGSLDNSYIPYEVVVHINGHAVRDDGYKIIPVNYWGQIGQRSEQEERIVSDKDEMKPLERYVKEIHVYVNKDLENEFVIDKLHQVNNLAQVSKVPIYFYPANQRDYFRAQRTDRAVRDVNQLLRPTKFSQDDIEWINLRRAHEKKFGKRDPASYLNAFIRIYHGDYSNIKNFPDKNVMNWILYYPHDAYAQLSAEIHNNKKDHLPLFRDVVSIMKKEGVKTFKELIDLVMKREHNRLESERDKLDEVEMAYAPGKINEPRWELPFQHARAIFTLYKDGLSVMMKQGTKQYTFYSNDKAIEKELNRPEFQKLEYGDEFKFTHPRLTQYVVHAISVSQKKMILGLDVSLAGRIFYFTGKGTVIGFWQNRREVSTLIKGIKWMFDKLGIDLKKAFFTFNNNEQKQYTFNQWMKLSDEKLSTQQKLHLQLQKQLHTNPEIKKAFLKLPLDTLQQKADNLKIPVAQLKQMLGSMD